MTAILVLAFAFCGWSSPSPSLSAQAESLPAGRQACATGFPEEEMSGRTGRFILKAMILLAALTWLAALALAGPQPLPAQGGAQQQKPNQPAAGGQQQPQKGPQPSPFAGPEDERLAIWQGNWEESVRFAGDPEDAPSGTGKWRAAPFWGLYIVINYELKGPEGVYHAHGVMAFDHEAKAYHLWWFDDGANINEYTGAWKDDTTLVFDMKRTSAGKVFRERITYSKTSEDEVHTKIEQAFGTDPFKLYLEAAAHRIPIPEGQGGQQRPQQQQPQQRRRPPNPGQNP